MVNDKLTFRPGLQASFGNNSLGWKHLTFNQQYDDRTGLDATRATGENFVSTRFSYPDVGAGGLLYSSKWWVGLSAHHLNQPRFGFETAQQRLPMKLTIHTGTKILVGKQERPRYGIDDGTEYEKSISPVILYKMQGKWDQLDLGFYARYNNILGGFWYRGIPLKLYPNEKYNGDAVVFLLGFLYKGFTFAYSYDVTVSQLTPAKTGGSHEFSLTYNFSLITTKKKKIPSKHKKPICPKI
jgi:type IX secretion system PorP/SprF family membrane protein